MAGCLRPWTAATGYDGGVLVLLSLLLGCPNETSGATYPAAALYRLDGAALLVGTTDAREGPHGRCFIRHGQSFHGVL